MNELRVSNELLERVQELERKKEELEEQVKQLLDDKHYFQERIDAYQEREERNREREERNRRLWTNEHLSGNHKIVLMHLEVEASRLRPELTDQIRIDMSAVGKATGLSRYTVGDKVRDLARWGAIQKTTEAVQMQKKGKKIEVDLVSVALNELALAAPEDIRPVKEDGEEYSRNHGGRRERCRRCKSENIQRVHHIRCLDCGDEYICGDEQVQDALQFETSVRQDAPRIVEASVSHVATETPSGSHAIHESSCPSDLTPSVSQVAPRIQSPGTSVSQVASRIVEAQTDSPSLSPSRSTPAPLEEAFSEAEADFWTRWRALTGECHLNEVAYKHIQELAHQVTTTQDLQSLYDCAYNRLDELAKAQGKSAVPPRLGNLVKCLPEWRQAQKRRDQERTPQQVPGHLPGTGCLTNWTTDRLKGTDEAPPVIYTRLETSARSKPKRATESGLSKITLNDLRLKRLTEPEK
jgi:hypothetical protein